LAGNITFLKATLIPQLWEWYNICSSI